jgi:hypothetical protein
MLPGVDPARLHDRPADRLQAAHWHDTVDPILSARRLEARLAARELRLPESPGLDLGL